MTAEKSPDSDFFSRIDSLMKKTEVKPETIDKVKQLQDELIWTYGDDSELWDALDEYTEALKNLRHAQAWVLWTAGELINER